MRGSPIIKSIAGSAIIATLLFIILLTYAPTSTAFATNNYGWNGLHDVAQTYSISSINSFSYPASERNGTVLLIVAPTQNFTQSEASRALDYVKGGGVLVVADSFGYSNTLLAGMGVNIRIEQNYVVNDPLYNWKAQSLPIAFIASAQYPFLANVRGLALDQPSPLLVTTTAARVAAVSSSRSFTLNRSEQGAFPLFQAANAKPIASGPFPMVAVEQMGAGEIVVIGDSSFFTNSVWKSANNNVLINNLLSNSTVYLDTSHWQVNTGDYIKAEFLYLYTAFSGFPLRYILAAAFVLVAVALLPVITVAAYTPKRRWQPRNKSAYNEQILDRIRRDRERYGFE